MSAKSSMQMLIYNVFLSVKVQFLSASISLKYIVSLLYASLPPPAVISGKNVHMLKGANLPSTWTWETSDNAKPVPCADEGTSNYKTVFMQTLDLFFF